MNNKLKLFSLLLCLVAMVSCSLGGHNTEHDTSLSSDSDVITTDHFTSEVIMEVVSVPHIQIVEERIQIGSSAVNYKLLRYPNIIFEDYELSDRINSSIKDALERHFKKMLPGASSLISGGAEIEYVVEKCEYCLSEDNRSISIAFYVDVAVFGSGVSDETADRSFFVLNLDLVNGVVVSNSEYYKDLNLLKEDILLGNIKPFGDSYQIDMDVVREALIQYRTDYSLFPDAYFSYDGVVVAVETTKSYGGYLLFKIPLDIANKYFFE